MQCKDWKSRVLQFRSRAGQSCRRGDSDSCRGVSPGPQLIKLACSFKVETPYFLVLDADTFFLSPMEALDLMQLKTCTSSSALCDQERQATFPLFHVCLRPSSCAVSVEDASSANPDIGTIIIIVKTIIAAL